MKVTRNNYNKPTREEIEAVRDFFLKPDDMHVFARAIAMHAYPESTVETYPNGIREVLIDMATDNIVDNFAAIHTHAESPIEVLFLSALCMNFISCNPLFAVFTPPITPDFPDYWRKNYQASVEMWEKFKEREGSNSLIGFIEDFKEMLESQNYSQDNVDSMVSEISRHLLMYHLLEVRYNYHFSPQTSFIMNGKTIRPDLYVWVPSQPQIRIIVECDGFEHHTSRAAFFRDRARDRALQIQGFQVFRFSGHEIYHDPISASIELFEYLTSVDSWHKEEL